MKFLAASLRFLSIVCCLSWQLKLANSQITSNPCELDITKLKENEPLYLKKDVQRKYSFVIPIAGKISLPEGKVMTVACTSYQTRHAGPIVFETMDVECTRDMQGNPVFTHKGRVLKDNESLEKRKCHTSNVAIARRKPGYVGCFKSKGDLMEVGFLIPGVEKQFVTLYESCIDKINKNVVYVSSRVHSANIRETMKKEAGKKEGSKWKDEIFFDNSEVGESYSIINQEERLKSLLGYETLPRTFWLGTGGTPEEKAEKLFLSRGHLSGRADHPLSSWREATYYSLNTLPQWQRVNDKNMGYVEDALRNQAHLSKSSFNVISGGYLVAQGKHSKTGKMVDLELIRDKVPVPKWLYKIVENPLTKEMISFLVLNNPHLADTDPIPELPCKDLFESNESTVKAVMQTWKLHIDHKNDQKQGKNFKFDEKANKRNGYTIACKVGDLKKKMPYLPIVDSGKLLSFTPKKRISQQTG